MTRSGFLVVEEVCCNILPFLSMSEHSNFRSCNWHIRHKTDSTHAWWVYCMIHFYKTYDIISDHACKPTNDVDWRLVARVSQRLGYVNLEFVHKQHSPVVYGSELALGIQLFLSSIPTAHIEDGSLGNCWCAAMKYVYYGYNVTTNDQQRTHHLNDGWYVGPYDYFHECTMFNILNSPSQHQPRIEFERFTSRFYSGRNHVASDTSVRMIVYLHPSLPWMDTHGLSVRLFLNVIFVDNTGAVSYEPVVDNAMSYVDISIGHNVAGVGTVFEDIFSPTFLNKMLRISTYNQQDVCMPVAVRESVVLCMQAVLINQETM